MAMIEHKIEKQNVWVEVSTGSECTIQALWNHEYSGFIRLHVGDTPPDETSSYLELYQNEKYIKWSDTGNVYVMVPSIIKKWQVPKLDEVVRITVFEYVRSGGGGSSTVDTSALSKETKQDEMITLLGSYLATEISQDQMEALLQSILDKLSASPATSTLQATQQTAIEALTKPTDTQLVKFDYTGSITPGLLTTTTTGTVAADTYFEVSILNIGDVNAVVQGQPFPPDTQVTYRAPNPSMTIGAITYDATGTTLVVSTSIYPA